MERKEAVKIEESIRPSPFPDPYPATNPLTGLLDFSEDGKSSLGFMELLGIQNFTPSVFDLLQVHTPSVESLGPAQTSAAPESSEVLNQPMTPNSSSISSASSGAANDEQSKAVDEEEERQKTMKQLKPKKTCQKRQREPRIAFMTKSEVDHLEDGYRWRKYGQKAVKNSPFPRSYYRCTSATCNVKKRVERCFSDPSIVVTTYEGKHTHSSPHMTRQTSASAVPGFSADGAASFALPMQVMSVSHHQSQFSNLPHLNCGYLDYINPTAFVHENSDLLPPLRGSSHDFSVEITPHHYVKITNMTQLQRKRHEKGADDMGSVRDKRLCSSTPTTSASLTDNGLLQDIVPSLMGKDK